MPPQRPSDRSSHPRPAPSQEKAATPNVDSTGKSREAVREWIVSRDDANAFQSIKQALRAAPPGAVIRVLPGLYQESLEIQRDVTIRGEGTADTIVLLSAFGPAVTVHGANAILQGMLFRSRTSSDRHLYPTLLGVQGSLFLENCQIRSASGACVEVQSSCVLEALNSNLLQSVGPGVIIRGGGSAVLDGCAIQGHGQVGILAEEGSSLQANGCEFSAGHSGIQLQARSRAELTDCAFIQLHQGAIDVLPEADLNLRNCHIEEIRGTGIRLETASGQIEDCLVRLCQQSGIEISKGGSVQIHRCRVRDCYRTGIHVHSRGLGTIEDCDIHGNAVAGILIEQRSDPVVRNCRIYEGVHACGILIRGSTGAVIEHCDVHSNPDPNIVIGDGANPMVWRCKVHGGGHHGILVSGEGRGKIQSCELYSNQLAGVAIEGGSQPQVIRCKVYDHQHASVFVTEDGSGIFHQCDLGPSDLAGVLTDRGGQLILQQCRIHGSAQAGISILPDGQATLQECQIASNALAGIMVGTGGDAQVINCQIDQNGRQPIRIEEDGRCQIDARSVMEGNALNEIDIAPGGLLRSE